MHDVAQIVQKMPEYNMLLKFIQNYLNTEFYRNEFKIIKIHAFTQILHTKNT